MKLYTVKEIAEILQVREKTIREWMSSRDLPYYRISGKCVRISDRQLESFLKKREINEKVSR